MNVFLGVSRTLSFLADEPGDKNFWCVASKTQPARPGDMLLMYFPVGVSRIENGILQIYRITSLPEGGRHSECGDRQMASIETELVFTLNKGITFKEMKRDKAIREWSPLRRRLQGVTFAVEGTVWSALSKIIETRNPEARVVLSRVFNG